VVGEGGGLSKDIEPAPDELADGVVLTVGRVGALFDFGLAKLVELAAPGPGRSGILIECTDFVLWECENIGHNVSASKILRDNRWHELRSTEKRNDQLKQSKLFHTVKEVTTQTTQRNTIINNRPRTSSFAIRDFEKSEIGKVFVESVVNDIESTRGLARLAPRIVVKWRATADVDRSLVIGKVANAAACTGACTAVVAVADWFQAPADDWQTVRLAVDASDFISMHAKAFHLAIEHQDAG